MQHVQKSTALGKIDFTTSKKTHEDVQKTASQRWKNRSWISIRRIHSFIWHLPSPRHRTHHKETPLMDNEVMKWKAKSNIAPQIHHRSCQSLFTATRLRCKPFSFQLKSRTLLWGLTRNLSMQRQTFPCLSESGVEAKYQTIKHLTGQTCSFSEGR